MRSDFPFSSHPHQELCAEMESKFHTYTDVRNAIHRMLESSDVVRGSSTEHSLSILEQKWASVYSKIQERKVVWPSIVMCPPCRFIDNEVRHYIWVWWSSRRQSSQKDWVWQRTSTAPSRSFSPRWASVRSLSDFFRLPALFWTLFVLNCRNTE